MCIKRPAEICRPERFTKKKKSERKKEVNYKELNLNQGLQKSEFFSKWIRIGIFWTKMLRRVLNQNKNGFLPFICNLFSLIKAEICAPYILT